MQKYSDAVQLALGAGGPLEPANGASILVTTASGATATLYSDNGVTTIPNPLTTNGDGEFSFYAANGTYTITTTYNGVVDVKTGVFLYDPYTDGGSTGFWPDVTATTKIERLRDRLFVGDAAASTGNRNGTQGGVIPDSATGANWAVRDASILGLTDKGRMPLVGFASNLNMDTTGGEPTETIGVAGFCIQTKADRGGWAGYLDLQIESTGTKGGLGLEIAIKNKSATTNDVTPYFSPSNTIAAIWLPAGGDTSYGGSPINDNDVGLLFGSSASSGRKWRKGIVFYAGSITGTDGTTGTGNAIEMAKGHVVLWRAPGNNAGFTLYSQVATAGQDVQLIAQDNAFSFLSGGSKNLLSLSGNASAVNYLQIGSTATGGAPFVKALGTDTNIDLRLIPQGTGVVRFGYAVTTATVAANFSATRTLKITDSTGTSFFVAATTAAW